MAASNFEEETHDYTPEERIELGLSPVTSEPTVRERTPRYLQLAQQAGKVIGKGFDDLIYRMGIVTGDAEAWDRFNSRGQHS